MTLLGHFTWTAENDIVIKSDIEQVPFFNAPIYTESKQQIGKVDEIFGAIRDYHVSIKLSENIKANSFEKDAKVFATLLITSATSIFIIDMHVLLMTAY